MVVGKFLLWGGLGGLFEVDLIDKRSQCYEIAVRQIIQGKFLLACYCGMQKQIDVHHIWMKFDFDWLKM